MITILIALALAGPNPHTLDAPRKGYTACLKEFETRSLAGQVAAAAYATAVKSACSAEAAALARALVAYDVAMGGKRASATANADNDIADYRLTSEERYRDLRPDKAP
ncbi:MAG: hypothetical protein M3Q51_07670 [Pseudomonadota bacterium]|nr:hypothetical protein [Pseudomonadota bacterium]